MLRAFRRMPRFAVVARSAGDRMAAADATPGFGSPRTYFLRAAEPRCHDAFGSLRRLHLHVGDLSGGRTLRKGTIRGDDLARTGEPPYPFPERDTRIGAGRGAAEPACHTAGACRLCA